VYWVVFENNPKLLIGIKMTLTEKEDALIDIEQRRKEFIKHE